MKTKFSKRILSLFLAVMMVVTSIPMFALTASAGVDGAKYLFAYFTGNTKYGQQIRFALSEDGYNFTALNDNKPVVQQTKGTSDASSGYARDPYITRDPNGNGFYMVATDMDASEGGMHGSWSGDSCVYVWHSSDLVNWDQVVNFDFRSFSGFENTIRAWAPQIIWDSAKGQYMMYLSITKDGDWNQMYYTYTSDFQTFTTPVKFEFSDGYKGRIDADIVENNGTYYMYYKDETSAKVLVATASSLDGTYTYQADVSSSLSTKAVEGNAMYQIGNSSTWVMMLDEYSDGSFAYGTTTDFINFTKYTGSTANNSFLSARHGSVMQISAAEYQALVEAFKSSAFSTDFSYMFDKSYTGGGWSYNEVADGCGHLIATQAAADDGSQTRGNGVCEFNKGRIFVNDSTARAIVRSNSFTVSTDVTKTTDDKCLILGMGGMDKDYLQVFSDGTMNVRIGDTFTSATFTPVPTNQTGHYAVCYNGTSTSLYIDGVKVATVNGVMDERANAGNGSFYVSVGGSDTAGTTALIGTVSSLRFSKYSDYDVALNAAVISTQDAFESKMAEITTSTIYTNIGNAYSAYVDLQKALDAVNFGLRTDVSLSEYIDKLNRAVGSMKETVNGVVSVNNSNGVTWNSGTITDTNYYSNVLWADTNINQNSDKNSNYMITNILANSSIVLLNDGNKIKYPVGAHIRKQWGSSNSNIKCLTASSTNYYVEANWTGGDKDDNAKNWVTTGTSVVSYSTSNTSYYTLSSSDMMFFRNYMTRNNSENTDTYYDSDTTLSYSLTNKGGKSSSSSIGNNVYTLNYLTLKNLLNSKYTNDVKNAVINVAKDISSYKEGGATNVLSITDCLIDPTAYDYSSNTASVVQEVAGLLKAKTEKIQGLSVTTTATEDSKGYANLRSAIDTAAGLDYSQYTDTSVNEYKQILSGARTLMAAVLENGYNSASPAQADSQVLNRIDALNPKLDKTEYNSQMTAKDKSLFTDSVQNYTFDSWKAVRDTINNLAPYKDRDGKYDKSTSTSTYYKSGGSSTYYPYSSSTDCTNTFNGLVNNLKALEFVACGDTQNFDAANTVVSSIDRAMYTDSALSAFDTAVGNAVAGVYHTVTDSEASTYGLTAGANVILTIQSETDEFTKALLEAVNTLNSAENKDANVNKYSAKVYDEAGNLKETLNKYYGESFVYSLTDSIADDDVLTWLVTVYKNDTDMNKALDGDSSIQPINSQVVSTYNGNTIERTANGSMVITYFVDAGSKADTTTYKVYNAYGNVIDVVYSTEAKDSSYFAENYPNPVLPFYTFVKWNVGTPNENGVVNVKPDFSAIPTKLITVDTSYATVDYSRASAGNAVVGSTVTITGNSADIYGWAVEAGGKYQIVGYGKDYKFNVYADENYVPVLYVDGTYTVNGAKLTADKVAGFSNNSNGNLSDDAYLKAKLDSKAPFVYVYSFKVDNENRNYDTYFEKGTEKVKFYIRVTAGTEADNLAYGIVVDGRKIASTAKNDGGQFYMATTKEKYNGIASINAYTSYTFQYTFTDSNNVTTVATIATADYAEVK